MKNLQDKIVLPVFSLLAICPLLFKFHAIQSLALVVCCVIFLLAVPYKTLTLNKKALPFIACFALLSFYFLLYYEPKSFKYIGDSFLIFIFPLTGLYLYPTVAFKKYFLQILLTYSIAVGLLCVFFIGFYIIDIPNHNFDCRSDTVFNPLPNKIAGKEYRH
jgi:hypothetical protein